MDYRPLLKAASERDFGAFETGLRSALFEKSLAALNDRAEELTAAISENREPVDLSNAPASLYMPRLKNGVLNEDLLTEAATRKDFRAVANLLQNVEDPKKRKELAEHHASIFHLQNPRFDRDKFMKAAGVAD